jgi:hypothetical protein
MFDEQPDTYGQVSPSPALRSHLRAPITGCPPSATTFSVPVQDVSTGEQYFQTIDVNTGAGGTLTVNPDGSVAAWDFSMVLTELPVPRDPIYDVFDRHIYLVQPTARAPATATCFD